jgi:hypothetical protein
MKTTTRAEGWSPGMEPDGKGTGANLMRDRASRLADLLSNSPESIRVSNLAQTASVRRCSRGPSTAVFPKKLASQVSKQ